MFITLALLLPFLLAAGLVYMEVFAFDLLLFDWTVPMESRVTSLLWSSSKTSRECCLLKLLFDAVAFVNLLSKNCLLLLARASFWFHYSPLRGPVVTS